MSEKQSLQEQLQKVISEQSDKSIEENVLKIIEDEFSEERGKAPIQSRTNLILEIMRWLQPALLSISNNNSVPYNITVVSKAGHGRTYMAHTLSKIIKEYPNTSPRLGMKAAPIVMNQHGIDGTAMDLSEEDQKQYKREDAIVIVDSLFPDQSMQISPFLYSLIKATTTVSFVSSEEEVKKAISQDSIILHMEDLTEEDIWEICEKKYVFTSNQETDEEKMKQLAKDMLSKDISPKSAIELMSVSSKLLNKDQTRLTNEVETPSEVLDQIIGKYSTVKILGTVPIENLRSFLQERVKGQKTAIDTVVSTVAMTRFGLIDKSKPVSTMLFMGPTGVGKTLLSRALSEAIIGRDDVIRIDMGEYKQPHHANKLFGSAPGYVGYETDTKLIRMLRQRQTGVILFDEIEKAHPDVHDSILQILDSGQFTSGKGEVFDLRKFFVIMTSNALADKVGKKKHIGFDGDMFGQQDNMRKLLMEANTFRPEFINRIDSLTVFDSLSPEVVRQIIDTQTEEVSSIMEKRGISIEFTDRYKDWVNANYDHAFGGRDVRRLVDRAKMNIANKLLQAPDAKELVVIEAGDTYLKGEDIPKAKEALKAKRPKDNKKQQQVGFA